MPALGLGLGLHRAFMGSGFSGLLDSYPGAAAAYSLRALSAGWVAGDVVNVRRSSDSAVQDFTASQILNGDLLTFTGAGDGFVTTWYDQSGNGEDATQATTTAQPKIVDTGSLVVGGLDFDGVDDTLNTALVPPSTATIIGVATSAESSGVIVGGRDSTDERSYISVGASNGFSYAVANETFTSATALSSPSLWFARYNGSNKSLHGDGVELDSSAQAQSVDNSTQGYNIGSLNSAGSPIVLWNGQVSEVIIYPTDEAANRVAIESNIMTHYGI